MPRQRRNRQRYAARGGYQLEVIGAARVLTHDIAHVPADTAIQMMRQQQDRRQSGGPEQRHGERETTGFGCRVLDELRDAERVIGVAFGEDLVGAGDPGIGGVAETAAAFVLNERVAGDMVTPAARARPQAEVVLLAVALAECFAIERTDVLQGGTADVHAEADGGGRRGEAAGVDRAARGVELRQRQARRDRLAPVTEPAADRGVVRQRRNAGDFFLGIGLRAQPAQPAGSHLGIAVQQRDIAIAGVPHAEIDRGDEPQILLVAQQRDGAGARHAIQPRAQFWLG